MGIYLSFIVFCFHWSPCYSGIVTDCCSVYRHQVHCPSCRLETIPQNIGKNTTSLSLIYNNIKALTNGSFAHTPHLERIVLSYNAISIISRGTFHHLRNLTYLDLAHNRLNSLSFGESAFNRLNNIETLIISNNNFHLSKSYPESLWLSLSQINVLYMDIFDNLTFEGGFLNLTKLETLTLNQRRDMSIRNTTFHGLESMNISKLRLFVKTNHLETNTLYPFQKLSSLYLSSCRHIDVHNILPVLHGLRGRKIETIELYENYVRSGNTVHLQASDIRFLSTICVKNLHLSNNAIGSISMSAVLSWTSRGCIEYLDVSRNSFQSPQVFFMLKLFPSIQYFDCSYKTSTFMRKRKVFQHKSVYLPNSLTYLNASHFPLFKDNELISVRDNILKVLDISNQLSTFSCGGHRFGNFSRLEEFIMSEIDCSTPHPTMFIEMQNLTKLTATSCLLNSNGMFYSQNLFKGLRHLSYVDLSSNQITHLNASTFEDQTNSTKTLIFANNLIDTLPIQILEKFKLLELFDLRNNFISSLSYSEYSLLETYRSVSNKIKIKLAGNPLSCDCSNLDFLTWVDTTSVIDDKNDLVCVQNNIKLVTFLETLRDFRVECASPMWLIVSISLALGFSVSGILLRFAWRHSVGLRIWCRQPVEQDTFTNDIFISYCSNDCGWIRKTFTTWLDRHGITYSAEDKTFDTGRDIYDNIMDAIADSYQSVFVVSCNFLENEWQTLAMKVASRYSFREGRQHMNILILLDDIQQSEFPKMVRKNWNSMRPLKWPSEYNSDKTRISTERKLFWEKLLKRIRKGNKRLAMSLHSESTV